MNQPITVLEYMGYYYVIEGNKRASVMKYLDARDIEADVTRVYPPRSDDPEIVVAAAKAGIETGSDYMKTRIQQLIANEKDQKVVEEIREAYHNKYFAND